MDKKFFTGKNRTYLIVHDDAPWGPTWTTDAELLVLEDAPESFENPEEAVAGCRTFVGVCPKDMFLFLEKKGLLEEFYEWCED